MLSAALIVNLPQSSAIAPELLLNHLAARSVAVNDGGPSSGVTVYLAIANMLFSPDNAGGPIANDARGLVMYAVQTTVLVIFFAGYNFPRAPRRVLNECRSVLAMQLAPHHICHGLNGIRLPIPLDFGRPLGRVSVHPAILVIPLSYHNVGPKVSHNFGRATDAVLLSKSEIKLPVHTPGFGVAPKNRWPVETVCFTTSPPFARRYSR
jgi:hypothetical protein